MSRDLMLIAGPCVIESEEHTHFLARAIQQIHPDFIFKASFDKANRTSVTAYRGPGLAEGLRILAGVKAALGVPVLTDIHTPDQAAPAAEAVDILQIPAFLCRQTDLLVEAGRTGRVVNIKKGQFVAPQDMIHAVEKVRSTGNDKVMLTERGSSFGYQNLVVDMRGLKIMAEMGVPVVFDATHSVQLPSGAGGVSGGQPQFIEPLARAAVAVGADGIFDEVHDPPEHAAGSAPRVLGRITVAARKSLLSRARQHAGRCPRCVVQSILPGPMGADWLTKDPNNKGADAPTLIAMIGFRSKPDFR